MVARNKIDNGTILAWSVAALREKRSGGSLAGVFSYSTCIWLASTKYSSQTGDYRTSYVLFYERPLDLVQLVEVHSLCHVMENPCELDTVYTMRAIKAR